MRWRVRDRAKDRMRECENERKREREKERMREIGRRLLTLPPKNREHTMVLLCRDREMREFWVPMR